MAKWVKTYAVASQDSKVSPEVFCISHSDAGRDKTLARIALYEAVLSSLGYMVEFSTVRSEDAEKQTVAEIMGLCENATIESLDPEAAE